jgi:methyltransferase-like protein
MIAGNFGPEVRKMLASLEADQIETEQYLDFLRNRAFRETLLVRASLAPDWEIDPDRVRRLHIASEGKPVGKKEPDIRSDAATDYRTRSGMGLTTRRPLLKAAMKVLADRWPGTIVFPDLLLAARALLGAAPDDLAAEADARELAANLVNTYVSSDLIELYGAAIHPARVTDRPVAMASARAGVATGATAVANQRHVLVTLSEMDRCLVPLLDGTRDRVALLDELTARVAAGGLQVQRDGVPVAGEDALRAALAGVLETTLKGLAGNALLVAGQQ